jgi:sulfur-oxidizing protein SoxZ
MYMQRRTVLGWLGVAGAMALRPGLAFAGTGDQAFDARDLNSAYAALGVTHVEASSDVLLNVPDVVEDAASVAVELSSRVPGTTALELFVDANPYPYIARFDLKEGALPAVAFRIRVAGSSAVRAVALAGGKRHGAVRQVKATDGGCAAAGVDDPGSSDNTDPMKIRARLVAGGETDVRVLVAHPMENGLRSDSAGRTIPAHFIRRLTARLNGKTVVEAQLGRSVATNPLFALRLRGAAAGDLVTLSWQDNRGLSRTDETRIAA